MVSVIVGLIIYCVGLLVATIMISLSLLFTALTVFGINLLTSEDSNGD